jgi:two-component system chemotaxis response regulator CheB
MTGPTTSSTTTGTLKVMVVDDTITYRSILSRILSTIPDVGETVTAANGKLALEKLAASHYDLVLLDIEMPEMDGLQCLNIIRTKFPRVGVVMVSGMNRKCADITIQALEAGAFEFIPKPDSGDLGANTTLLRDNLSGVLRHFKARRQRQQARTDASQASNTRSTPARPTERPTAPERDRDAHRGGALTGPSTSATSSSRDLRTPPPAQAVPAAPPAKVTPPRKIDVVVIGVSTGGPNALGELIPKLPANLGVPILLVQHMPPVFTASLASSLDRKSPLTVKEAADNEPVTANTIYIAPGGHHMTVENYAGGVRVKLNDEAPENSCRPAVDVLFRSVAATYGRNILSVVLTGMGSDGALGVKVLKQQGGCHSIIQSEKSCVVYGMPRAVAEMNLADEVLDLDQIAERITQYVTKTH